MALFQLAMIESSARCTDCILNWGMRVTPNIGDEVHLTFEGQNHKVAIVDNEVIVSGGEPDMLLAFLTLRKGSMWCRQLAR